MFKGPYLALVALVLSPSIVLGAAKVEVEIFEFHLNDESAQMSQVSIIKAENWSGYVNFTYELGPEAFMVDPLDIVNWEKKMNLKVEGAQAEKNVEFAPRTTTVSTRVMNASGTVQVTFETHLETKATMMSEGLSLGFSRKTQRFSFATPSCNLPVDNTKIVVHIPQDSVIVKYLPTKNFTLLPQTSGEKSVVWHFTGPSASAASVYIELSKKRGLGIWSLLLLFSVTLGVVSVGLKLLLSIYEDSIRY